MDINIFDYFVYLILLSVESCSCVNRKEARRNVEQNPYPYDLFLEVIEPESLKYIYRLRPARDFGHALDQTYHNIELVISEPLDACSTITNTIFVQNNIVLVERGGCSFLTKALNAEEAGAAAVIVTDNNHSNNQYIVDMITDGTSREANIAAFFMLGKDGFMIRSRLSDLNRNSAVVNIPVNSTFLLTSRHLSQPPWTLW